MSAKFIGFKEGVTISPCGLARMVMPFGVICDAAPALYEDTVFITSMNDSKAHSIDLSMHYASAAWDIRTHPADGGEMRTGCIIAPGIDQEAKFWIIRARKLLGPGWQFLYEADKKHIHLEYDYGK